MKDKVFIAWSGSNTVAMKVKRIMEKDRKYVCSIGGNADNNSQFSSVGDTVIQQIKICNQAIVIFQNRKDGNVSNNLFFELGYVLAKYGQMKVHCVKRSSEVVTLPSDFDNSFVESLEEESDDDFAQKIVDYVLAFDAELKKLMAPIGNSSLPIGRSDALVSTDKAVADKLGIQYVC